MVSNLIRAAIAAVIALALLILAGAWAYDSAYDKGWADRERLVRENNAQELERRYEELKKNLADTRGRDAATIARLESVNAQQTQLARSLSARLKQQEETPYVFKENANDDASHQPPLLGQSVLDDGTVRMLDRARAGLRPERGAGSASDGGHEESGAFAVTAPAVTGREFAENDLAVVRMYHQLATRHNDLVDWVSAQCNRRTAKTNDH